jgi:hypothetical protein
MRPAAVAPIADTVARPTQDADGAAGRDDSQPAAARSPLLATEALEPTAAATDPVVAAESVAAAPVAVHAAAFPATASPKAVGPQPAGPPQTPAPQTPAPQTAAPRTAGQQGGGQQSAGEPQYVEPVDPWATGEAAAFGNVSGGPILHPVSGAPVSASPVSAGPASPAAQSWLASTHPEPGGQQEAGSRLPAYKRKGLWIVAAATVVVLGAAAAVVAWFWPGYPALDYQPLADLRRIKPAVPVTSAFSGTALRDGRAYFASVAENGTLGVVATATDTGKTAWTSTAAGTAARWEFFFAVPDAVVAITDSDSVTSQRRMVLLDPGNGKKLWERTMDADDDVLFVGDKAMLIDRREGRLVGLEIGDKGKGAWEQKNPKDDYGQAGTKVVEVTTGADFTGPASADGVPFAEAFDDDQRIVQIGADDSARVIDAGTGDVVAGPRQSVAQTDDKLIAHDGRLIVAESADARRLFAYDLAKLEPKVLYTPPTANTQLDRLTPCGTDRICLIETAGYAAESAQVVAIDAAKGGVVWRRPIAGVDQIVPVGDAVLATTGTSPAQVSLLDGEGKVSWTHGGVVGRIDAGNTLQFSKALSTSPDDPALAGEHVGDKAVPLGSLDGIRSSTCTWDATHLACVAAEDFVIQRFAD